MFEIKWLKRLFRKGPPAAEVTDRVDEEFSASLHGRNAAAKPPEHSGGLAVLTPSPVVFPQNKT